MATVGNGGEDEDTGAAPPVVKCKLMLRCCHGDRYNATTKSSAYSSDCAEKFGISILLLFCARRRDGPGVCGKVTNLVLQVTLLRFVGY